MIQRSSLQVRRDISFLYVHCCCSMANDPVRSALDRLPLDLRKWCIFWFSEDICVKSHVYHHDSTFDSSNLATTSKRHWNWYALQATLTSDMDRYTTALADPLVIDPFSEWSVVELTRCGDEPVWHRAVVALSRRGISLTFFLLYIVFSCHSNLKKEREKAGSSCYSPSYFRAVAIHSFLITRRFEHIESIVWVRAERISSTVVQL